MTRLRSVTPIALAAAGGITFFVWRQSRKDSATTSGATPPTDTDANGLGLEQYESLLAQLRDLQGEGGDDTTTPPPDDTTTPPAAAAPTRYIVDYKLTKLTPTSASISWGVVGRPNLTLIYMNHNPPVPIPPGVHSFTFSNLKPGNQYRLGVALLSNNKPGPRTDLTVTTPKK